METGKKRLITIIIILALIAALIILHGYYSDLQSEGRGTIVLPTQTNEAAVTPSQSESVTDEFISVNRENFISVLNTISRPSSYYQSVELEYIWKDGSGLKHIELWRRGDMYRVGIREEGSEDKRNILIDGDNLSIWYDSSPSKVYRGLVNDDFSIEDLSFLLSYESLIELEASSVLDAAYISLEGANCLYLETTAALEGYVERHWIALDTGLLIQSVTLKDGEIVININAGNVQILSEDELDDLFVSP